MGTKTPTSPADTAIRRAKAFLRVVREEAEPAGTSRVATESQRAADDGSASADERQMVLPHVSLDTAGAAIRAILSGAPNYNIQPLPTYRNKDNPKVKK